MLKKLPRGHLTWESQIKNLKSKVSNRLDQTRPESTTIKVKSNRSPKGIHGNHSFRKFPSAKLFFFKLSQNDKNCLSTYLRLNDHCRIVFWYCPFRSSLNIPYSQTRITFGTCMHFLETLSSIEIIADHVIVTRMEIEWNTLSIIRKNTIFSIVIFEGVYKGGQIIDGIDKW